MVKLLREEASKPSVSCIAFRRIIFDEDVAAAVLQLYRSDVARKWKQIEFYHCTGLIEVALTAPLVLDAVESFTIPYLDVPTSIALGTSLSFSNALRCLRLKDNLFEENCAAIANGLEENTSLKELNLKGCAISEEAVLLLAKGLGNSHSQGLTVVSLL